MVEQIRGSVSAAVSDYDKVGGGPAVTAVVDRFYQLLLDDLALARYFEGTDLVRLKRHQVLLISQVLGGPAQYDGRDLRQAHAGLAINHDDFDRVVSYLLQALDEAGVDQQVIARTAPTLVAAEKDIVTVPRR